MKYILLIFRHLFGLRTLSPKHHSTVEALHLHQYYDADSGINSTGENFQASVLSDLAAEGFIKLKLQHPAAKYKVVEVDYERYQRRRANWMLAFKVFYASFVVGTAATVLKVALEVYKLFQ